MNYLLVLFKWVYLRPSLSIEKKQFPPTRTTEAQNFKITLNSKPPHRYRGFHSSNHHKWFPYQFYVKTRKEGPDRFTKQLNVTLSVSDPLVKENLSF